MTSPSLRIVACLLATLVCCVAAFGGQAAEQVAPPASEEATAAEQIDPAAFFGDLVERYRRIEAYHDAVDAHYVTEADGQSPHRVRTKLACRVADGRLRVETAGSQLRGGLGLDVPISPSSAVEALVLRYNLWLAPHMALRFTEEPLRDLRQGVEQGFVPVAAEPEAGRPEWVRLELTAGEQARFLLFVDPGTMLVRRIEGEQVLPDGRRHTVTLEITPLEVRDRLEPEEA